jgi:hypothetical protein
MKLSLEETTKLIKLSEKASDLLVRIIDEPLPKTRTPTKNDIELNEVLSKIYLISPLLSDSYMQMYNHLQKGKISSDDSYITQLKKQD